MTELPPASNNGDAPSEVPATTKPVDTQATTVMPNITCRRCGTVTTWNPYCPTCNAYLEFAGTPAWHPVEVVSTAPPPATPEEIAAREESTRQEQLALEAAADPVRQQLAAQAERDAKIAAHQQVLEEAASAAMTAAAQEAAAKKQARRRGAHRSTRRKTTTTVAWWKFWRRNDATQEMEAVSVVVATTVTTETTVTSVPPDAVVSGEPDENTYVVPAMPVTEVIAELPEHVEQQQQRTLAQLDPSHRSGLEGGVTCSHCGHINPVERAYCEHCGSYLYNFALAPTPPTYEEQQRQQHEEMLERPNRSKWYRNAIVLAVACLIVFLIWFFFYGPMATQTRTWFRVTSQKVTEFFDPTVGTPTTVKSVTASSTLAGTDVSALSSSNSRDYWASGVSPKFGTGSTITYELAGSFEIDRMIIAPGIQNGELDVRALAQPADITLKFSDGSTYQTTLAMIQNTDQYSQLVTFSAVTTKSITLTINSVYPPRYPNQNGSTNGSVAVSSMQFLQVPNASTVTIDTRTSPTQSPSPSPSPTSSPTSSAKSSSSPSPSGSKSSNSKSSKSSKNN